MENRKLIYIASPYAGDVEGNVAFAKKACRHCIEQGHTPIAVHLLYPQMLDDSKPKERELGLALGRHVLQICDEMWVCGDHISSGMGAEIAEATKLGKPIIHVSALQMVLGKKPQYGIYAEGFASSSFGEKRGFLCENGELLLFEHEQDASTRLQQMKKMRLNNTPSADFMVKAFNLSSPTDSVFFTIDYEIIRALDTEPGFDPTKFEVKTKDYGNTGGGCMVATVEMYLPELDRSVWVNCNDEGVDVTATDYVWHSDVAEYVDYSYEDVSLYQCTFTTDSPSNAGPWLPMIKEALVYTIQQENQRYDRPMPLPVAWLPDSIRATAEPDYLAWAEKEEYAVPVMNGRVEVDDAYIDYRQANPPEDLGLQ